MAFGDQSLKYVSKKLENIIILLSVHSIKKVFVFVI